MPRTTPPAPDRVWTLECGFRSEGDSNIPQKHQSAALSRMPSGGAALFCLVACGIREWGENGNGHWGAERCFAMHWLRNVSTIVMRRFMSLLPVLLGVSLSVAPSAFAQDVEVGLRNGVVRSTVQGEVLYPTFQAEGEEVRQVMQTGLQVAGFLHVPLGDRVGLQLEVQYTQKGARFRDESEWDCGGPLADPHPDCFDPAYDGTYRLSYVEFPVLLTWSFPIWQSIAGRAAVGPSLNGLAQTSVETARLRRSALPEHALTPDTHTQLGAVGEAGIRYEVSSGGVLLVNVRYHADVTALSTIGAHESFRNHAFVFGLGYAFQL